MKLVRNRWQKVERKVAKEENGRVQAGSGSPWHCKGDVKSDTRLVQVKSTSKRSFVLKLVDLQTIERQAASANRDAVFVVAFGKDMFAVQRYYGL